jgi:hypothetical protein
MFRERLQESLLTQGNLKYRGHGRIALRLMWIKMWVWAKKRDRTGSASCLLMGFGDSGVDSSGSATREL